MPTIAASYGAPRTPIRIIEGKVYAWVWNGHEKDRGNPVYRLRKPTIGHSLNGRLLSYPTRGPHITEMRNPTIADL